MPEKGGDELLLSLDILPWRVCGPKIKWSGVSFLEEELLLHFILAFLSL